MRQGRKVLRSWWASVAYFGATVLVGVALMGLVLDALPFADTLNDAALAAWLLGLPALLGFVIARRIGVWAQGDEIMVVNPFRTHRLRRQDLHGVELGRSNYVAGGGTPVQMLQVLVRGGRPVQIVASIRVREAGLDEAKRVLLAARRRASQD